MGQDSSNDRLDKIRLFSTLGTDERRALAKECNWRAYNSGQVIFDRNEENRDVMFVVKGSVVITSYSITGREISFDTIAEGNYFGEIAAIDMEPRSATVVAKGKCEIASLTTQRFRQLIDEHKQLRWEVLNRLAQVIRVSNERIMDFATLTAQQRVCSELLRQAKPDPAVNGHWSIYPMPTQVAIASQIGATRETVARVLGELVKAGVLKRKGRAMYITDKDKLELLNNRLHSGIT